MQRNLAIGVTAAVAGVLGGVWLMWPEPIEPLPPVVRKAPRAEVDSPDSRDSREAEPVVADARPRPAQKPPPPGAGQPRAPKPGERPHSEAKEPFWDPPPPDDAPVDTGLQDLPPPGENIGLPPDDVDAATMISLISQEPVNLPERPLSDFEMDVLLDRKKRLDDACAPGLNEDCKLATLHMDDAIAGAHHMRKQAVLDEFGDDPPPLSAKPKRDPVGTIPDE